MKKIGFLSFGHWMDQGSLVKTAQDSYLQSIDLAVEAEKIGMKLAGQFRKDIRVE